jgi:RAB6A-GEF complex partner protein 1
MTNMFINFSYSVEDTGPVSSIAWTPDNCALAVGWRYRGMAVWSVSGCRLMCTARQSGLASASSPIVKLNTDFKSEPLIGGTALLQWDEHGYRLFAIEESSYDRAIEFSFSKCCLNRGLSGTTFAHQFLYGDDRVLLVQRDETDELKILQLNVPVKFRKINILISIVNTFICFEFIVGLQLIYVFKAGNIRCTELANFACCG